MILQVIDYQLFSVCNVLWKCIVLETYRFISSLVLHLCRGGVVPRVLVRLLVCCKRPCVSNYILLARRTSAYDSDSPLQLCYEQPMNMKHITIQTRRLDIYFVLPDVTSCPQMQPPSGRNLFCNNIEKGDSGDTQARVFQHFKCSSVRSKSTGEI